MGDFDYAYPGFAEAAVENNPDSVDAGARYVRPRLDVPLRDPQVGNHRYRILRIDRHGSQVTATLCNYLYGVAGQQPDGTFYSLARGQVSEPKGISAEQVELRAPADAGDLAPQEGPAAAPSDDVFGGWRITGYLAPSLVSDARERASQWPSFEADTESCAEAAPDSPERRAFLTSGTHPREEFATAPPSPGWPAGESN
jgi:hypothetical protein